MLHFRMCNILKFTQSSSVVLIPYLLIYSQQCFVTTLLRHIAFMSNFFCFNGLNGPLFGPPGSCNGDAFVSCRSTSTTSSTLEPIGLWLELTRNKTFNYLHTNSCSHVMLRCTSDILYDVIVVQFPGSEVTVLNGGGFPRNDVTATACDNDSEADYENEAGRNCEWWHGNKQHVRWTQVCGTHLHHVTVILCHYSWKLWTREHWIKRITFAAHTNAVCDVQPWLSAPRLRSIADTHTDTQAPSDTIPLPAKRRRR